MMAKLMGGTSLVGQYEASPTPIAVLKAIDDFTVFARLKIKLKCF